VRTTTSKLVRRRASRRAASLLSVAVSVIFLAACSGSSANPPARAGDLYQVDGETAHLQCQGVGSPTLVLLGGRGFTTTTWDEFRAALGPDVRTCAWDYPGVGHSVTRWPDIPFEILLHDPAVYATRKVWSDAVEAHWGADQAAFAALAPRGTVRVVQGSGHNVYQDAQAVSAAAVRRVLDAVVTKQ
jgi:pimeloyl-ACP methyl ester carboxylesterase